MTMKSWVKTPSERERQRGPIPETLSTEAKRAFALPHEVEAEDEFNCMPARPKHGTWLAEHVENGQSVRQFENSCYRAQPHATYDTIYVELLGEFDEDMLTNFKSYMEAFFLPLRVVMKKQCKLEDTEELLVTRINESTGRKQARTDSVLEWAKNGFNADRKSDRMRRQICCVCLTSIDLYPSDDWNFVFGLGDLLSGYGVWSMARMHPSFPGNADADYESGTSSTTNHSNDYIITMKRSLKVICHEIGHLFGLRHCVLYRCLMNGSNHLEEMDSRPHFCCPVCLRKLHIALGFDPIERYRLILKAHRECIHDHGHDDPACNECVWLQNRIDTCTRASE